MDVFQSNIIGIMFFDVNTMFGELVIIGKKVGKLPEAATWALE